MPVTGGQVYEALHKACLIELSAPLREAQIIITLILQVRKLRFGAQVTCLRSHS